MSACRPDLDRTECLAWRYPISSCDSCREACPAGALEFLEGRPHLVEEACDGCRLCESACPTAALEFPAMAWPSRLSREVDIACGSVDCGEPDLPMTCVHALGVGYLIQLYEAGVRELRLTVADCSRCQRNRDLNVLQARVDELNRALQARKLGPLRLRWHVGPARKTGVAPWSQARRGFLARIGGFPPENDVGGNPIFAGLWLKRKLSSGPLPWVPTLESSRCTGCSACARCCPTGAILLAESPAGYRLNPEFCSGCGLCIDLCETGAIGLERWQTPAQFFVPLVSHRCPRCGVTYQRPHIDGDLSPVCDACAGGAVRRPDRVVQ